jgi:thiosulfate/3-mercaptopyruvate sulfurtransferase
MPDTLQKDAIVSTTWLAEHLDAPDVRVVDASWYLPTENRDPKAEYAEGHIPGAVYFDIDEICDTASPLPHMLPSAEKFTSRVRRLGLGDGARIVIYDGGPLMAAARVWFMFRVFGHRDVSILDGGFTKWKAEGLPVEDMPPMSRERHYTARLNTMMLRDMEQMRANLNSGREQVVDARSPGRFAGTEAEPRPGLRGGHIPGALNVPFRSLLAPDGTLLKPDQMTAVFEKAGVDLTKPVVGTCGSGVSACVVLLALHVLGHRKTALYDGSWAEWGSIEALPAEI